MRTTVFVKSSFAMMAVGILMVWQPWVHALFRSGFAVILFGIISFTVASHLPSAGAGASKP